MAKKKAGKAVAAKKKAPPAPAPRHPAGSEVLDLQSLLSEAVKKSDLSVVEKLLEIRGKLKAEAAKEAFYDSLRLFQAACPVIGKGTKAQGKKFSYNYATLQEIVNVIREPLSDCGFSYTIDAEQEGMAVTAICYAHHVAGYTKETRFTAPIDPDAYMNAPQRVASALTYAKRYALCNAFGIVTGEEDDDTNCIPRTQKAEPKRWENSPKTERVHVQKKAETMQAKVTKYDEIKVLIEEAQKLELITEDEIGIYRQELRSDGSEKNINAIIKELKDIIAKEDPAVPEVTGQPEDGPSDEVIKKAEEAIKAAEGK